MAKDTPPPTMIKMGTGYGLPETMVTRSFLEAYGIPVWLTNYNMVTISPNKVHGLQGIELYVPTEHAQDAALLLSSLEPDPQYGCATKKKCRWLIKIFVILLILAVLEFISTIALHPFSPIIVQLIENIKYSIVTTTGIYFSFIAFFVFFCSLFINCFVPRAIGFFNVPKAEIDMLLSRLTNAQRDHE